MAEKQSRLIEAATSNDCDTVKEILKKRSYTEDEQKAALFLACGAGCCVCAVSVLESGISIESRNEEGYTPLLLSAKLGHSDLVKLFLRWDSQADAQGGPLENTALHYAASEGYQECCRGLLSGGADVNARNIQDDTPLILASMHGHLSIVRILLSNHASVRRRGYHERTALHCATENGHLSICKLLLNSKADLEEEDTFGNTPLICAAEKGYVELMKLFFCRGCDVNKMSHIAATALHYAAQHGDVASCELLLENNAEIDAQDIRRFSPLMMGSLNGHDEVVRQLIDWKCNVNMVAYNKRSALHLAAERGKLKCCCLLLQAGAHIDAQDSMGCTPLHVAAHKGQIQVMNYLLDNGADRNRRPFNGNSLLHLAASGGSVDCVQELIRMGLNVTDLNNDGDTPLICAVNAKQVKTAQVLLDAGCSVDTRGQHGMTALNMAVFYNHSTLTALLLEYGADPDVEDDAGTLPLWFAIDGASPQVVKMLVNANSKFNVRSSLNTTCGPCNPVEHAAHKMRLRVLHCLISAYCEPACNTLREHLPTLASSGALSPSTVNVMRDMVQAPNSLLELCRRRIRSLMGKGGGLAAKICQVKLPTMLQDYLNFSEFTETVN